MITALFRLIGPGEPQRRLRASIAGIVAGGVLQGVGFAVLVPLLDALARGDTSTAWRWAAVELALLVTAGLVHYRSQMDGYLGAVGAGIDLFDRTGDHLAKLPLGWFDPSRVGQLGRLTSNGVVDVMGVPAHLLRPLLNAAVTPLTVLVFMFVFDWRLAVAALVSVPFLVLAYLWTSHLVRTGDVANHAAAAAASGRVVEFAQEQHVLRAFGRSGAGLNLLDDALVDQRDASRRLMLTTVPGLVTFVATVQAAFTLVLVVGVNLALGGGIGAAELVALLVLVVRFVEPLVIAGDLSSALRLANNAIGRIDELLRTEPLPETEVSITPADGSVSFEGVGFAYGDTPVLHDVSFHAPERTMLALVGPSGSGKTTVTRLLARFWDVSSGSVRVGGVDVRDLRTEELMGRLSIVFQDVYLFDGSIEENVRLGREDVDDEELRRVARLAGIDEVVDRLPDGWSTQVGEGGTALSGGERQRVSIARALLKQADVLVLDEATAALDPENEVVVERAMAAALERQTVVVIAHRLETVRAADLIVVLGDGSVVETGTHQELLDAGGRYADFWDERLQAAGWRLAAAP